MACYVAGVVWSLLRSDARPIERRVLALCWPLGPLAFVATVTILLAAAAIAYPIAGVPVLAGIGAACWWVF